MLEAEHEHANGGLREDVPFSSVLGDILHGRRVSTDNLVNAIFGFAAAAFSGGTAAGGPGAGAGRHGHGSGQGRPTFYPPGFHPPISRPPPGPSPEEMARQRAVLLARQELGFQPREPLTQDVVERRRKELARKHHPDLGGSVARMASINQAADLLLEPGNLR